MAFPYTRDWAADARASGALADLGASWLDVACAQLPYGLLLLESDLTVRVHLGRALPAGLPVQVRSGRLVLPAQIRRHVQLLLTGTGDTGPVLLNVQERGATTVALVIERVCGDEAPALWRAAVFAEGGVVPTSEALRLAYRMTPSEAGVVRQLVAGRGLRAAAQHLRISHETARAHLKSAFLKANVRCQAALVARVLSGPAIALGHDGLARSPPVPC
jgi:DNA-binding CsgD family transcriptional regulator